MKLSNKQAYYLVNVLYETCKVCGNFAGLSVEDRLKLYNQIIQQQSEKLIELADEREYEA